MRSIGDKPALAIHSQCNAAKQAVDRHDKRAYFGG